MYFMDSTINFRNNPLDAFEFTEKNVHLLEFSYFQHLRHYIGHLEPTEPRDYLRIYLRMDSKRHAFKLEHYDVLTYLADLGGLFSTMFAILGGLTSLIVSRKYSASLVKKVYRI